MDPQQPNKHTSPLQHPPYYPSSAHQQLIQLQLLQQQQEQQQQQQQQQQQFQSSLDYNYHDDRQPLLFSTPSGQTLSGSTDTSKSSRVTPSFSIFSGSLAPSTQCQSSTQSTLTYPLSSHSITNSHEGPYPKFNHMNTIPANSSMDKRDTNHYEKYTSCLTNDNRNTTTTITNHNHNNHNNNNINFIRPLIGNNSITLDIPPLPVDLIVSLGHPHHLSSSIPHHIQKINDNNDECENIDRVCDLTMPYNPFSPPPPSISTTTSQAPSFQSQGQTIPSNHHTNSFASRPSTARNTQPQSIQKYPPQPSDLSDHYSHADNDLIEHDEDNMGYFYDKQIPFGPPSLPSSPQHPSSPIATPTPTALDSSVTNMNSCEGSTMTLHNSPLSSPLYRSLSPFRQGAVAYDHTDGDMIHSGRASRSMERGQVKVRSSSSNRFKKEIPHFSPTDFNVHVMTTHCHSVEQQYLLKELQAHNKLTESQLYALEEIQGLMDELYGEMQSKPAMEIEEVPEKQTIILNKQKDLLFQIQANPLTPLTPQQVQQCLRVQQRVHNQQMMYQSLQQQQQHQYEQQLQLQQSQLSQQSSNFLRNQSDHHKNQQKQLINFLQQRNIEFYKQGDELDLTQQVQQQIQFQIQQQLYRIQQLQLEYNQRLESEQEQEESFQQSQPHGEKERQESFQQTKIYHQQRLFQQAQEQLQLQLQKKLAQSKENLKEDLQPAQHQQQLTTQQQKNHQYQQQLQQQAKKFKIFKKTVQFKPFNLQQSSPNQLCSVYTKSNAHIPSRQGFNVIDGSVNVVNSVNSVNIVNALNAVNLLNALNAITTVSSGNTPPTVSFWLQQQQPSPQPQSISSALSILSGSSHNNAIVAVSGVSSPQHKNSQGLRQKDHKSPSKQHQLNTDTLSICTSTSTISQHSYNANSIYEVDLSASGSRSSKRRLRVGVLQLTHGAAKTVGPLRVDDEAISTTLLNQQNDHDIIDDFDPDTMVDGDDDVLSANQGDTRMSDINSIKFQTPVIKNNSSKFQTGVNSLNSLKFQIGVNGFNINPFQLKTGVVDINTNTNTSPSKVNSTTATTTTTTTTPIKFSPNFSNRPGYPTQLSSHQQSQIQFAIAAGLGSQLLQRMDKNGNFNFQMNLIPPQLQHLYNGVNPFLNSVDEDTLTMPQETDLLGYRYQGPHNLTEMDQGSINIKTKNHSKIDEDGHDHVSYDGVYGDYGHYRDFGYDDDADDDAMSFSFHNRGKYHQVNNNNNNYNNNTTNNNNYQSYSSQFPHKINHPEENTMCEGDDLIASLDESDRSSVGTGTSFNSMGSDSSSTTTTSSNDPSNGPITTMTTMTLNIPSPSSSATTTTSPLSSSTTTPTTPIRTTRSTTTITTSSTQPETVIDEEYKVVLEYAAQIPSPELLSTPQGIVGLLSPYTTMFSSAPTDISNLSRLQINPQVESFDSRAVERGKKKKKKQALSRFDLMWIPTVSHRFKSIPRLPLFHSTPPHINIPKICENKVVEPIEMLPSWTDAPRFISYKNGPDNCHLLLRTPSLAEQRRSLHLAQLSRESVLINQWQLEKMTRLATGENETEVNTLMASNPEYAPLLYLTDQCDKTEYIYNTANVPLQTKLYRYRALLLEAMTLQTEIFVDLIYRYHSCLRKYRAIELDRAIWVTWWDVGDERCGEMREKHISLNEVYIQAEQEVYTHLRFIFGEIFRVGLSRTEIEVFEIILQHLYSLGTSGIVQNMIPLPFFPKFEYLEGVYKLSLFITEPPRSQKNNAANAVNVGNVADAPNDANNVNAANSNANATNAASPNSSDNLSASANGASSHNASGDSTNTNNTNADTSGNNSDDVDNLDVAANDNANNNTNAPTLPSTTTNSSRTSPRRELTPMISFNGQVLRDRLGNIPDISITVPMSRILQLHLYLSNLSREPTTVDGAVIPGYDRDAMYLNPDLNLYYPPERVSQDTLGQVTNDSLRCYFVVNTKPHWDKVKGLGAQVPAVKRFKLHLGDFAKSLTVSLRLLRMSFSKLSSLRGQTQTNLNKGLMKSYITICNEFMKTRQLDYVAIEQQRHADRITAQNVATADSSRVVNNHNLLELLNRAMEPPPQFNQDDESPRFDGGGKRDTVMEDNEDDYVHV